MRRDFTRHILVSLHDLRKAGAILKFRHGLTLPGDYRMRWARHLWRQKSIN